MRHVCPSIAALCLCAIVLAAPVRAVDAEPLSPERIQRAIEKAREFLVRQQKPEGWWEAMHSPDKLPLLTLLDQHGKERSQLLTSLSLSPDRWLATLSMVAAAESAAG